MRVFHPPPPPVDQPTLLLLKLGRGVEIQTTHIVPFKSPGDVMQISTLKVQLGLGSKLVDWYPVATSVLYGHLLIDLSPRTGDRLCYCTNTESIPSKFYMDNFSFFGQNYNDFHKWEVFLSLGTWCKF